MRTVDVLVLGIECDVTKQTPSTLPSSSKPVSPRYEKRP